LKGISTVSALLEHTPVKSDIGINVRGFKDEVVPECQLRCESFKENKGWRVQPFITNHSRIIDECRIWRRISRRGGYPIVRGDPKWRWTQCISRQPALWQCWWCHAVEILTPRAQTKTWTTSACANLCSHRPNREQADASGNEEKEKAQIP
jgi:hypothetical protein